MGKRSSITFTVPEGGRDLIELIRLRRGHQWMSDAAREAAELGFYVLERVALPGATQAELEARMRKAGWRREAKGGTNPGFPIPPTPPAQAPHDTQPMKTVPPMGPNSPARVVTIPPPMPADREWVEGDTKRDDLANLRPPVVDLPYAGRVVPHRPPPARAALVELAAQLEPDPPWYDALRRVRPDILGFGIGVLASAVFLAWLASRL